jgi:hypothetical protein
MTITIMRREDWGATAPQGPAMTTPSRGLWLHHTVTSPTVDPVADMRVVQRIGVQRFGRISYSWVYHQAASVFLEGAGNTIGAHTGGQNSTTHGLAIIGDFTLDTLPHYSVRDLAEFVRFGAVRGWWQPVLLGGHRDAPGAATVCPGKHAYDAIGSIRAAITHNPEEDAVALIRRPGRKEVYQALADCLVHVPNADIAQVLAGPLWRDKVVEHPIDHPIWTLPVRVGFAAARHVQ